GGDQPATGGAPQAVTITDADRAAAKQKFETLCFTCHGMQGEGDGPASAGLVPPPRNFKAPARQASGTDEHIGKSIVGGGLAVGKSLAMPADPDLNGRPGVAAALREHIRKLGKSAPKRGESVPERRIPPASFGRPVGAPVS